MPTPGARKPFKVLFKREDGTAFGNEVPVGSMSEGEHVIRETLGSFTKHLGSTSTEVRAPL